MAIFAIGDVHGQMAALERLLKKLAFDRARDTLWFVGDLINRGPHSYEVLQFVHELCAEDNARRTDAAIEPHRMVLGNHDIAFLRYVYRAQQGASLDKMPADFERLLDKPDIANIAAWLGAQPLLHYDPARNILLVHAGLPWGLSEVSLLDAVAAFDPIRKTPDFYDHHLFGNKPKRWKKADTDIEKARFLVNATTRLRYVDGRQKMQFDYSGAPRHAPDGYQPWFMGHPITATTPVVFGHWSALPKDNLPPNIFALDTGAAWGGHLTALCIEATHTRFTQYQRLSVPVE